jgi:hypothetical protein
MGLAQEEKDMELKAALGLTQLMSMLVFASIAAWYVVPWLARQERATALTALVWPHVFRYVALQAYSAQRAGFPISDAGLTRLVYGDLAGAALAFLVIVALRHRVQGAAALTWLLVATTAFDTVSNISNGIHENLFGAATGVTWMVVSFYVPLLMVSLALTVWQLYSRFGEPIATSEPGARMRIGDASIV